jgi:hypothetical protein
MSKRVVLPEPFAPITAMRSLTPTLKLTPAKSVLPPYDLEILEILSILNPQIISGMVRVSEVRLLTTRAIAY